jgi:ubiquinone/menaquinone biosynthesis C-methylase UbiE
MLYHVPDRPRARAEIHRVLSPNGRLFAMTNGNKHMLELRGLVKGAVPDMVRSEEQGFSLESLLTLLSLRRIVERTGGGTPLGPFPTTVGRSG